MDAEFLLFFPCIVFQSREVEEEPVVDGGGLIHRKASHPCVVDFRVVHRHQEGWIMPHTEMVQMNIRRRDSMVEIRHILYISLALPSMLRDIQIVLLL